MMKFGEMPGPVKICLLTVMLAITGCAQQGAPMAEPPPGNAAQKRKETAGPQERLALIQAIMAESGMDATIEQLPAMAAMGFDQQPPPPVNREAYEKFRQVFLGAFDRDEIRGTIVAALEAEYDPQRFAELLRLLRSPLVRKMIALEVAANTPQAQQEMMRSGNILMGQLTPHRQELLRRLDEVTGATDDAVDLQVMMTGTLVRNMNRIVPPAQRKTDAEVEGFLQEMRRQMRYPARQYTYLSMAYAYRSVKDADLEAYLGLFQTGVGHWSVSVMRDAWRTVAQRITVKLATAMERTFVEQNAF